MSQTIDFGIDLGTTNSVIAHAHDGKVEILRNPLSLKETLPSVVAYRKSRILVGEKAREFMERDPENVVGGFKRKMGTADRYFIRSLDQQVSPVDLSAQVLKELRSFVHGGIVPEAVVITIPASFDTIQSNATHEAGRAAGFDEVVLLQEPIAASLAFANRQEEYGRALGRGQWLVYDLGGGTFDVALVRIKDGEMRVLDHEGDNFLGGGDFDDLIVTKIIVPKLQATGKFEDLERQLKSAKGRHNGLYFKLLLLAEEAKIRLSSHDKADIEFEAADDEEEDQEFFFSILRSELEALLDPYIDQTISMIERILVRNNMESSELDYVLMVGGSTYIPRVRERVGAGLNIAINCDIDPTTAVGEGAAYYAATKPRRKKGISLEKKYEPLTESAAGLQIRMAYARTSKERTEYFTAKVEGELRGLQYRIVRTDGGFDSGLKDLLPRIEEDLPLMLDTYNVFKFTVIDQYGHIVREDLPEIGITQGKYSVSGQPLPADICIEIDDLETRRTKLEPIFKKNEILPLRRTITKQVMKTIRKGQDEQLVINVLEGSANLLPAVSLPIGFIIISGKDLERDVIKGSDVDVTVEISESRDLKISAVLLMTDQEFTNVFSSNERQVNLARLEAEIQQLLEQANDELMDARLKDDAQLIRRLDGIREELEALLTQIKGMAQDDVTDSRYQLDDRKRKLARELSETTQDQALENSKLQYFDYKRYSKYYIDKYGTVTEQQNFNRLLEQEREVLRVGSAARIDDLSDRLLSLSWDVRWRTLEFLSALFSQNFSQRLSEYPDQNRARSLITEGNSALARGDVFGLQSVIRRLYDMLPPERKGSFQFGTGIG